MLAEFEGATLNPVAVTVSAVDSDPVSIDLTGPASLRLEDVDVGVTAPNREDIADNIRAVRPSTDDDSNSVDSPPGVIAFTVEGTIRGVTATTFEPLADDGQTIESIEFAVDEPIRGDGGSGTDVIFELTLSVTGSPFAGTARSASGQAVGRWMSIHGTGSTVPDAAPSSLSRRRRPITGPR